MRNYLPPGVYQAPTTSVGEDLRLVRTDVAGFVGYAERGPIAPAPSDPQPDPLSLAVRLTSWAEYRRRFGGLTKYAYMPYAVRAFFENGGNTCYVTRVAASSSTQPGAAPRTASFTQPTGDWQAQVTTVTQAALRANSDKLTVASTARLVPGMIIGVGTPDALQKGTVKTVVDGQNLTLTGPLSADVAAGVALWDLGGTMLAAKISAKQTDLQVTNSSSFHPGDVVTVSSGGQQEVAMIDRIADGTTLHLASRLQGSYEAGALLQRQVTGLNIQAISPGNWGNRLRIDLVPKQAGLTTSKFDLWVTLTPGPEPSQPAETETFFNLSLNPKDDRYVKDIVNSEIGGSNLICVSLPQNIQALAVKDGHVSYFPADLSGGRDGLADISASDFIGGESDFRGLRVLEEVGGVGIILAPDAVNAGVPSMTQRKKPPRDPCSQPAPAPPPNPAASDPTAHPRVLPNFNGVSGAGAVFQAMIDQARRLRYRFAVLDPPDNLEPGDVTIWLSKQNLPPAYSQFAAIYYPWVSAPDGLNNELTTRRVTPGGYAAGVYAQVDNSVGVQEPPANIELAFAVELGRDVTGPEQGRLNEQGVNVIRAFAGRGLRIWGARSLAAAYPREEWWFLHVRRTLSMIEDTVEKSMQWTVFSTNDYNLRRTLAHSLTVLLEGIWRAGGLKGALQEEAFYVKCDETNNPQSQINQGRLVCEVGVAIAAPMEFLVFQVCRLPDGTQVLEV